MQHRLAGGCAQRVAPMHRMQPGCDQRRRPGMPLLGLPRRVAGLRTPGRLLYIQVAAQRQRQARPAAQANAVPVTFSVKREVKWGQTLSLVGGHPALGDWSVKRGPAMGWKEGHFWTAEVALQPGAEVEFKVVQLSKEGEEWEDGYNHSFKVPSSGAGRVEVLVKWGKEIKVSVEEGLPQPVPAGAAAAVPEALSSLEWSDEGTLSAAETSGSYDSDQRLPTEEWQGKETRFMTSNEHSGERSGVWRTEGLDGPLLTLVEGDRDHGSWLGKLGVVKRLLVDAAPRQRPDLNTVASVYVYLQWIATGAVPCVEGGGHQRPNRHAELSRLMFRSLEWVIEDAGRAGGVQASLLVARRLHTRLPSFTEQFTQSVPLTRIRDIAHRSDIPSDLKREIKHTIQNKLHRNAGPEDLVATEAMLQRITKTPGQYPTAFVEEFKKFTAELRDFFNASTLADMLTAVQPSFDDSQWQLVDRFLASKAKLDADGPAASQNCIMDALHGVTSVRALLAASLSSGLRNDAPDKAMIMRQRFRLCEVRAEDYAFVLLSRFINTLEEKGGAAALAGGNDGTWALPIGALVLGLRNVGLCGFELGECMAVERELMAWQNAGGLTHRDNALRLRATLQRLQRLSESYVRVLMDAYTPRATKLGAALGLDPHFVSIFPEAEIRASVVFQLSKLCSMLLRAAGMVVGGGQEDWEVIVAGEARGLLVEVDSLEPGCLAAAGGKAAVALVAEASGDEEVAALGPQLRGVILRHAIPHLSHLGVRARQEHVPFVCCEDEALLRDLTTPLLGRPVKLVASVDGATISADYDAPEASSAGGSSSLNGARAPTAAQPAPVQKVSGAMRVLPLEDATPATCGAKGAACGELLRLAKHCEELLRSRGGAGGSGAAPEGLPGGSGAVAEGNGSAGGALFHAPGGVCLPFGCMEVALQADGRMGDFEGLLSRLDRLAASGSGGELEQCCGQLEGLIRGLRVPQQVLQQVSGAFKPGCTVIARSSANVEDLAGLSGAGLYDSVPNVDSNNLRALEEAVTGVWASLFTRRAVLSRQAAGVPQSSACMAVVVQSQLAPDLSFVLHTAHPLSRDPATLAAELAPGLGETLAAGTRGSGWRLEVDKASGRVTTRAFANFSRALLPPERDATNGAAEDWAGGDTSSTISSTVQLSLVDYSQQPMSASEDVRSMVGRRLTAVGRLLEHEFGGPQDVEGCFSGGQLYVVQTRPQP